MNHPVQTAADICVLCVIGASLASWLPPIAAALGIVYHLVLLWPRIKRVWRRVRGK